MPLSPLAADSGAARGLATLWWVMLVVFTVILVGVLVLLLLAYVAPHLLRRLSPTGWVIAGGLAMPIPVLLALTGVSLVLGETLQPRETGRTIEVTAARWNWTFSYGGGAGSTDVLHLPVDEPVRLVVGAEDVIHGFWIPRLGPRIDAIPGYRHSVVVEAERPGTYRGVCVEYCGAGHDVMSFVVEAHAPADYEAIIEALP